MIHILRDGQQFGPYTIEDINTFLSEGSLLTSDQAWHEGSEGWIPITEVPGVTFTEGTSLGMPTDQNTIAQSAVNSSNKLISGKNMVVAGVIFTCLLIVFFALFYKGQSNPPKPSIAEFEKSIVERDKSIEALEAAFDNGNRQLQMKLTVEFEEKNEEYIKRYLEYNKNLTEWYSIITFCVHCKKKLDKQGAATCFQCGKAQTQELDDLEKEHGSKYY